GAAAEPAARSRGWDWSRAEVFFLVALALFLPLFEAPKNLFWFLYLIAWCVNRVRSRQFGGPWRAWDTLIAAVLAGAVPNAALAGLHGGEWGGARDVARHMLILWAVTRSSYDSRVWRRIFIALFAGALAAAAVDIALVMPHRRDPELSLHSVGHPNHSAIYL